MEKSSNPFFQTVNGNYGESWKASNGAAPLQMNETPEYKDIVSYSHIILRIGRTRTGVEEFFEDLQTQSTGGDEREGRVGHSDLQ